MWAKFELSTLFQTLLKQLQSWFFRISYVERRLAMFSLHTLQFWLTALCLKLSLQVAALQLIHLRIHIWQPIFRVQNPWIWLSTDFEIFWRTSPSWPKAPFDCGWEVPEAREAVLGTRTPLTEALTVKSRDSLWPGPADSVTQEEPGTDSLQMRANCILINTQKQKKGFWLWCVLFFW